MIGSHRLRRTGAPPPGWDLAPTWGQPLYEPEPLRATGAIGRWAYFALTISGFLLVAGFVLVHDDRSPGLSARGLLAIALAATVVVLLTLRRAAGPGPLARALTEYSVVFVLTVLVATTGVTLDPPPTPTGSHGQQVAAAPDLRPPLVKTIDTWRDRVAGGWGWLVELWRRADHKATSHPQPPAGEPEPASEALAPTPPLPSSTRRLL
jgi:hypothetical protein